MVKTNFQQSKTKGTSVQERGQGISSKLQCKPLAQFGVPAALLIKGSADQGSRRFFSKTRLQGVQSQSRDRLSMVSCSAKFELNFGSICTCFNPDFSCQPNYSLQGPSLTSESRCLLQRQGLSPKRRYLPLGPHFDFKPICLLQGPCLDSRSKCLL